MAKEHMKKHASHATHGGHDHVHPSRTRDHGPVNPHNAMGGVHVTVGGARRAGGGAHGGGGKYGKDHPENFIEGALTGGQGPSEGIHEKDIGHGQTLVTAVGMDNVRLAADIETSILDQNFHGGPEYLGHSLKGVSAVNEDIGAAGPVHHDYIQDH